MQTHHCLCVLILSAATAIAQSTVTNDDAADPIYVCHKDRVDVTWYIAQEAFPHAARFFLGNCIADSFSELTTGRGHVIGQLQFDSRLTECKFKRVIRGKHVVYRNTLTFRPKGKKSVDYNKTIECVYNRTADWIPPFLTLGSGSAVGHGQLVFQMALLNEELTDRAQTNVIPLGSFIPIWAAVQQAYHQPLLLLMEECVAATTPELHPDSQVYPIITNKGCLVDGTMSNSRFLDRYETNSIILNLQSFRFAIGQEVYIHSKLVAWDPEILNEDKKACHYVKDGMDDMGIWELLDDPSRSKLCSCCDSTCKTRPKRDAESEPQAQGLVQRYVLGPLIVVDPDAPSQSTKSSTAGNANLKLLRKSR